jgi:hypothetical protein
MPKCKKYVNTTQLSMGLIEPGRDLRTVYEEDSDAKRFVTGLTNAMCSRITMKRLRRVFSLIDENVSDEQMRNTVGMMVRSFLLDNARNLALKQNLMAGERNQRVTRAELEKEIERKLLENPAAIFEKMKAQVNDLDKTCDLALRAEAIADLSSAQIDYLRKQKRQNIEQLILFTGYVRTVLSGKAA